MIDSPLDLFHQNNGGVNKAKKINNILIILDMIIDWIVEYNNNSKINGKYNN